MAQRDQHPQHISTKQKARRQRRQQRRRQRILEAAAQVFASKGYAATTTREIAEAADVAEGTLYNYFDSKREILLAVAEETSSPMETAVLQAEGLAERDAMVALFETAFDISEAQLPFARTLLSEAWIDDGILEEFLVVRLGRVQQRLEAYIRSRISAGTFRAVDPRLGARLAIGMFAALILPVLRGVQPLPATAERRQLAEAVADFILDGVRSHPAGKTAAER